MEVGRVAEEKVRWAVTWACRSRWRERGKAVQGLQREGVPGEDRVLRRAADPGGQAGRGKGPPGHREKLPTSGPGMNQRSSPPPGGEPD